MCVFIWCLDRDNGFYVVFWFIGIRSVLKLNIVIFWIRRDYILRFVVMVFFV